MIRHFIGFIFILLFPLQVMSATLKSESEIKQITDKIMAQVANGNTAEAFTLMKPYIVIPDTEFQSIVLQSEAQRNQFSVRFGKTIGYDYIDQRKAGDSILRLMYIEKTEKHAFPWIFIFYKTPAGWVLNTFAWNDNIMNAFTP